MKRMMKYVQWIIMGILVSAILICFVNEIINPLDTYEYIQPIENVETVEIIVLSEEIIVGIEDVSWGMTCISSCALNEEEYSSLLSKLTEIDGNAFFNPPSTGYGNIGDLLVRITYLNSEVQLVGPLNSAYYSLDGEWHHNPFRFLDHELYDKLVREYLVKK